MTTSLKLRRGTTAQHASFTGAEGEVTVDTTKDTVVVHDGSTAGGFPLAKEASLTSGLAAKADTTYVDGRLNTTFAFKNRIINGDMRIDQRNAGASASTYNTYSLDRWYVNNNSGASRFTWQQNAGAVTPPVGFTNYMGVTSTSAYSVTSTNVLGLAHYIEGFNIADLGWGTANAKTVTLSFVVRSSLTGTFGGAIRSPSGNATYPFTYSIPASNTWTTISVTISGPTIGTWATNNSNGLEVWFSLGTGSTYSGSAGSWSGSTYYAATGGTSVVGTNGATFYLTGVQLEVGSSATPFDTRAYGTELALCQRYYQTIQDVKTGQYYTGSANPVRSGSVTYAVIMRTAPTVTFVSPTFGNATYIGTDGNYNWGFNTYVGTSGGGAYYWQSNITASAEL